MYTKILIWIGILSILIIGVTFSGCFTQEESHSNRDKNSLTSLSQVKVAVVYQSISDYQTIEVMTNGKYKRTLEDVVSIFKETNTDFVFRVFWRWGKVPDSPEQATRNQVIRGYTYEQLGQAVREVKREMPDIILCGAIPAQKIEITERNPITGKIYSEDETWAMALDPGKWGIDMSKEEFQCRFAKTHGWFPKDLDCSLYNPKKAPAYFPDITNPEFQELILSWAKKQIDIGIDAIWIDLLFTQVNFLGRLSKDQNHPAVKESYDAACKIIDEIHKYGELKGRKIYVGTWAFPALNYPYPPPSLDFVTLTPTAEEVRQKKLDESKWDNDISRIRQKLGDVPIIAFIDWASTTNTPLGQFSQELSKGEQREFLRKADKFFSQRGIIFAYPVHGGWMGDEATVLSFGKTRAYDSLAPEFQTYETIKELAQKEGIECQTDADCKHIKCPGVYCENGVCKFPPWSSFDIEAINNFVDVVTQKALDEKITDPSNIAFILDMHYILKREPPEKFKEYAFYILNETQHNNGFWRYKEFHYAPDTARLLITYNREGVTPPHKISEDYYRSIDTWDEVVAELNRYERMDDSIVFWGGLWGYVTLWQLKGEMPPWLDDYIKYAYEDFDNWKFKNHERNHLVGTFLQIDEKVPNQEELISIIVRDQNPEDGGWGFWFRGEKSSSIETAHTLYILKVLGYEGIDEVAGKSLSGILKSTYKTMVKDDKKIAGWSYYPEDERMDIRSTTIVLMTLAKLGVIDGNSDPYSLKRNSSQEI